MFSNGTGIWEVPIGWAQVRWYLFLFANVCSRLDRYWAQPCCHSLTALSQSQHSTNTAPNNRLTTRSLSAQLLRKRATKCPGFLVFYIYEYIVWMCMYECFFFFLYYFKVWQVYYYYIYLVFSYLWYFSPLVILSQPCFTWLRFFAFLKMEMLDTLHYLKIEKSKVEFKKPMNKLHTQHLRVPLIENIPTITLTFPILYWHPAISVK